MMKERPVSRVFRTRAEAKASYDRMSSWYDLLAGIPEKRIKEKGINDLNVINGEKVLEIGFGTGECILALAHKVGIHGKVYGIDLSEGMHSAAISKVEKAGLSGRVELACGDALDLPYGDNSMEAIFTSFTLELFDTPEIPVVLRQCKRVLCPGGRLCVVSMAKREQDSPVVALYEWAHAKFPRSVDCRPIYAQKSLEEAGFRIETVTEMQMFGLPVEILLSKKEM